MKSKLLILASLLLTFALAEEKPAGGIMETKVIDNLISCTIKSSAPQDGTEPPVAGPADKKRIGGWGDFYPTYLRWELQQAEKVSQKVFLGFTLKSLAGTNPPEKIEVRLVTSGDNNPIRTGPWEPAKLQWSLAPSSEHLITLPYKEGATEVDITDTIRKWVAHPETNFGFVISSTTNQNTFAYIEGFLLKYQK